MNRIFGMMLAFALCFAWFTPMQAAPKVGKTELKAEVCSMPVVAVDQMRYDVLKSVELDRYCPEGSFTHEINRLPLISVMEKCRFRFSKGRNFNKLEVRNPVNPGTVTQAEYAPKFRLYSLRC